MSRAADTRRLGDKVVYNASVRRLLALALVSAGALLYELALTRVFAVAQFHHFAFMLISLGLLGSGASGTILALRRPRPTPRLDPERDRKARPGDEGLALGFSLSAVAGYLVLNYLPFDSFSIAWDGRQVWRLAFNFLALAVPFLFAGLMVGAALADKPRAAHRAYAANLIGSAAGCALVVLLPPALGGERTVIFAAWLGTLAGLVVHGTRRGPLSAGHWSLAILLTLALLRPPTFLALHLSPYKPLAQALLYPGARTSLQRWSASARVDLVESPGIRSLPGLSYTYLAPLPRQSGLAIDGDALAPITHIPRGADLRATLGASDLQPSTSDLAFGTYLPERLAFELRPGSNVLVIEPGGGLDVLVALASGAARVTAAHGEPLAAEVVFEYGDGLYGDPRVTVVSEPPRSFLARSPERYDVVLLALTDPYRPVTSGAYSLAETYLLTEEAIRAYLDHLAPGGVLALGRWLQSPPSEELRTYATILAALDGRGVDPERAIIALRSFQSAMFLVEPGGFANTEIAAARDFAESRRFDFMALPGLRQDEVNRFNVLPQPVYSETFTALRTAAERGGFFTAYPFDVRPTSDDRPFFFHFFKWSQTPAALQTLGKTWEPFGGSGYFILLALLALAAALAGILIAIPLIAYRLSHLTFHVSRSTFAAVSTAIGGRHLSTHLLYFACLGFGFLLIEIPLAQRYILYLGRPIYALAAVLGGLLAFSGIGSLASRRLPLRPALIGLIGLALLYSPLTRWLFATAPGMPLWARLAAAALSLAPLGVLMGVPFPAGLGRLAASREAGRLIPLAWAVNGGASVVSAVLAAVLALSFGFSAVLRVGAAVYGVAVLTAPPRTNGTNATSNTR